MSSVGAIPIKVTELGSQQVLDHLMTMQRNFTAGIIGQFIDIALQAVEDEAKGNAPVLTGRLRDSIVHQMLSDNAGICFVGVDYGAAQEWGYHNRAGVFVPGKNYFAPAVIHGKKLLMDMLTKYVQQNSTPAGAKTASSQGPRGTGGTRGTGTGPHKYLYKVQTGSRTRYVYGKKDQTITRRTFRRKPTFRQQKGGGRRFGPGGKFRGRRIF